MFAVVSVAVGLGLLRTSHGPVFALGAGCVVGCYLAPAFAHRGMRKLDGELEVRLSGLPRTDPRVRRRPTLLAQAYVLIWFAWFFAGVVVAAMGLLFADQLGRARIR
jgi:hypothetical protein